MDERIRIGSADDLIAKGQLTGKVGSQPVCVFWSDGRAYAVDDRCPHMGFPLHRGTVENGLLTCHWHHARFDLESGGTLDPFADDVRAYPVEIDGNDVVVVVEPAADRVAQLLRRLDEGLEQGLTLVMAKAVLGLLDALGPDEAAAGDRAGRGRLRDALPGRRVGGGAHGADRHGQRARRARRRRTGSWPWCTGWRSCPGTPGATPRGSRSSRCQRPLPAARLGAWYRRFIDTRSGDAAERILATAVRPDSGPSELAAIMGAAATDHVFLDGGHTIDFTNKAFEVLDHVGLGHAAPIVLPTLAHQTAGASRAEETGAWRHPDDLAGLLGRAAAELPRSPRPAAGPRPSRGDDDVDSLAWVILGDDPAEIVAALDRAVTAGATRRGAGPGRGLRRRPAGHALPHPKRPRRLGRRPPRLHRRQRRAPAGPAESATPELARGVYQGAVQGLPRPLPQRPGRPAARPSPRWRRRARTSAALQACWDQQGMVDEAGAIVYGWLAHGRVAGRRCWRPWARRLLREDAEFHWFQTYEAAVRQSPAWPEGSEPVGLILAGAARFLAAHTPTRPGAAPGGAHRRPAAPRRAALRAGRAD